LTRLLGHMAKRAKAEKRGVAAIAQMAATP
jgi:hypothetical protein